MKYFFGYVVPGVLLILLAFLAGAQRDVIWGLFAFLPFFTVGVILIIEGWKKTRR